MKAFESIDQNKCLSCLSPWTAAILPASQCPKSEESATFQQPTSQSKTIFSEQGRLKLNYLCPLYRERERSQTTDRDQTARSGAAPGCHVATAGVYRRGEATPPKWRPRPRHDSK